MTADHNDPTTTDEQRSTDTDSTTSQTAAGIDESLLPTGGVARKLRYAVIAGLALLALIATLQFYFAASRTINTWIAREYQSLFQALFNLTIMLLAGAGILWQLQKLRR